MAFPDGIEHVERGPQRGLHLLRRGIVIVCLYAWQLKRCIRVFNRAEPLMRRHVFIQQLFFVYARHAGYLVRHGVKCGHEKARPVV